MDLDDAIREGWRIIDEAMRQELAEAPKPLMRYLRKCEWDVLQVELAKCESPLHQYIRVDKDGRLTCCGVELRRIEYIWRATARSADCNSRGRGQS